MHLTSTIDNTPEGKRKKRKIEAEGLISNSKKIRRLVSLFFIYAASREQAAF